MAKLYWLWAIPDGFVFNMSVGYDLEGIRGPKVDTFIERHEGRLRNAYVPGVHARFCHELFPEETDVHRRHLPPGSPTASRSPPSTAARRMRSSASPPISLTEKDLHTFVKCNPTLLGYEFARSILDAMGYDYIAF